MLNNINFTLESIEYGVLRQPLIRPYELSFGSVEQLEIVWVFVTDNLGRPGLAETVPLPGYAQENLKEIVGAIKEISPSLLGIEIKEALQKVSSLSKRRPFAASSLAAAIDFIDWKSKIRQLRPVSLVHPVAAKSSEKEVAEQFLEGLTAGFQHFKMKLGRNLEHDILSANFSLREFMIGNRTIRFDVNQAYDYKEAVSFCRSLESVNSEHLLWVEQPLPMDDWGGMRNLCREISIPLMLDESIYTAEDVMRAKEIGCKAIKLKLFKHPGITACLELARSAGAIGLDVTIGNGVASDICNLTEAMIISAEPNLFVEGAECNGFVKLSKNIAFNQLTMNSKGQMFWDDSRPMSFDKILVSLKEQSDGGSFKCHK